MSNYEDILNDPAFDTIEKERKKVLTDFFKRIENKSVNEIIPEFMMLSKNMPKGHDLTAMEKKAVLTAAYSHLSNTERAKLDAVMRIIGGID
ncbi:MAG: hypothetical protein IJ736_06815 [Firmicutes bacterium]|nr:hypothetical protein [Bacillota bacterium]